MSLMVRASQAAAAMALGLAAAAPCQAAEPVAWSRNPHGFELGIQQQGAGDISTVTVRACRKPSCFKAQGDVSETANPKTGAWEMTLPIAAGACALKIVEVARGEYDTNDWRITAAPAPGGSCASAPPGVTGVYKSE
jgi:hypothetical protein